MDEPLLREKFRVAANKIKKDQTPGNKEDSDRNNKAVNSEKYHLKEGFFVWRVEREEKIKYCLSEEDDHDGDSQNGSPEISIGVPEFHRGNS